MSVVTVAKMTVVMMIVEEAHAAEEVRVVHKCDMGLCFEACHNKCIFVQLSIQENIMQA
jgi:hypothetical protein